MVTLMTLTGSQSTVIISGSLLPTKRKHAIINSKLAIHIIKTYLNIRHVYTIHALIFVKAVSILVCAKFIKTNYHSY